jgi:DNA-binding GntR family transcriptional regulator
VSPSRLADLVADRLVRAIGNGDLEQGARIRDIDLAESLGVSRMPVREALQRLEQIGLIETSPSRFTRVTPVSRELAEESLAFAGYAGGVLFRLDLPDIDDRDIAALSSDVERLGASTNPAEMSDALRDLLRTLIDAGPSHFLGRMLDKSLPAVWCNVRRYAVPVTEMIDPGATDALSTSIRMRDAALAEVALRRLCRLPA